VVIEAASHRGEEAGGGYLTGRHTVAQNGPTSKQKARSRFATTSGADVVGEHAGREAIRERPSRPGARERGEDGRAKGVSEVGEPC